jgi:hypothetical protein
MNSHKSLGSQMSRKEVEGSAPVQTLGHIDPNQLDTVQLRAQDAYYPAKFEDNRDIDKESKMALKLSLNQDTWGQRNLDEGTVDYLYDKAKQQEMRNFDAWYATIFDHRDPAQLKLSREINPGWFDRRVKAIDESLDFQKKIARMNLMGIRNQEDVLTAYAIATGRIEPALYNTNFMQPTQQDQELRDRQYVKGMFAPRLFDDYIKPAQQLASATDPLNHSNFAAPIGGNITLTTFKQMMQGQQTAPILTGGLSQDRVQNITAKDTTRLIPNRTDLSMSRARANRTGGNQSSFSFAPTASPAPSNPFGNLPSAARGSGTMVDDYYKRD